MSRQRRLLAILASLAIVVFAIAGFFVYRLDLDAIKHGLERNLSTSFGAQVLLQGAVKLQLLPPGASFPDVVIRGGNRDILTARRIRAGIALLPMLWKEVRLSSLTRHGGVLSIGDAIIRADDALGFVPDELMGDDPQGVKRGLRRVFTRHLALEFDSLLLAHGEPWIGHGKAAIAGFLAMAGQG